MAEELDGLDVDLSRLPPDLQPLAPLIRKWAVSDDEERSARLAAASDDELQELRDAPRSHWDATNTYLDENITSDESYEGVVLDSFSQAAMEAADVLEERDGSS